jgi:hypothetical protein
MICTPPKYYSCDQIENNEISGACNKYWGRGEMCTRFWWGNLRERDHFEDRGVGGRIILKWILRK